VTKRRRYAAGALALSVLVAGLLAPGAAAKKTKYSGPLLGPPAQTPGSSLVYFRVVSAGKGKKAHPVAVLKFKAFYLGVTCTYADGSEAEPSRVIYRAYGQAQSIVVTKRQFALTDTFPAPYGYQGSESFQIRGRIPRKGPVTGTIRHTGSWTASDFGQVTCDSTTSWTASVTQGEFPE
jgi:hypothetical protein